MVISRPGKVIEKKNPKGFGKVIDICYIHMFYSRCVYIVCFGILIVSLNTTSSHFFMYTPSFYTFGHGEKVGWGVRADGYVSM